MACCWAGLPKDLLVSILERLFPISDYVRFSAVCKPWLSAALDHKQCRLKSCNEQLPMLMIQTKDDRYGERSLYIINQQGEGRFSKFKLRVPFNKRCCGSSYGWLAIVEKNMCILLINPFSGEAKRLPPLCNLLPKDKNKLEVIVKKVIFSMNPSVSPDDFMVVAVYGCYNSLAFYRSGGKSWKYLKEYLKKDLHYFIVSDVIFYKGMLYAVDLKCRVMSINFVYDTINGPWKFKLNFVVRRFAEVQPNSFLKSYIVESSGGDLLLVQRCLAEKDDETQGVIVSFKVFKMAGDGGKEGGNSLWVEIKCLANGDTLFLGENHSMCVSTLRLPGCQPNSIYYTEDAVDCATYPHWPRDMGIFNLEDGSFDTHYMLDPSQKHMPPPAVWVWVVPSLNFVNTY